jgi:RNA polymerase sigma-70 factor, ECF subfamily
MRDVKKIYQRYKEDIYKYLYYLTRNKELAEDLVQETFLQAFTSIHRFKGNSKVRTWLFQIAKFVYYNHSRKNKKEKISALEEIDFFINGKSPEHTYLEKEREQSIFRALASLSDPYKQVVILKLYNELSFREIGDVFEKSENWARVTFHRGKLKLLQLLEKGGNFNDYQL